jgi:hypothetical protein
MIPRKVTPMIITNGDDASSWPSIDSMGMKDMLESPPLSKVDAVGQCSMLGRD